MHVIASLLSRVGTRKKPIDCLMGTDHEEEYQVPVPCRAQEKNSG